MGDRDLFFDTVIGRVARLSDQQSAFACNTSTRTILFEGGVGSGKTTAMCAAVIDRSVHVNPPTVSTLVVAPTYKHLKDPVIRQMEMMCEGFGINHALNKGEMVAAIGPGQALISYRSGEIPRNLKGPNVAILAMDECASCEPEVWQIGSQRVRDPRAVLEQKILGTTPEGTETWVEALKATALTNNTIAVTNAPTSSNRSLSSEFLADMELIYKDDPAGYAQYINGIATNARGAIYHLTDANLRTFDRKLLPHAEIVVGQDYNARWMVSVIIAWIASHRTMHVIGEVVSKDPGGISTTDHAKRVVKWLREHDLLHHEPHPRRVLMDKWMREVVAYTDASGDNIHSNAYLTDDAAMRNAGFVVRHDGANPLVRSRIATMNRGLARRWIMFSEKDAPETVRAVRSHSRNKRGEPKKNGDFRAGEFQADHYCDAVGYTAWGLMPFRAEDIAA